MNPVLTQSYQPTAAPLPLRHSLAQEKQSWTQPSQPSQRIACLWFPSWAIQRRIVCHPELRKQHLVLFRRDSRRGQLVAAASPLANKAGVTVGMPLTEAKSLLESQRGSGGLNGANSNEQNESAAAGQPFYLLEHQPQEDVAALEAMVDSLESYSPIAGVEVLDQQLAQNADSPECVLLDVTGLAHLFGDEQRLAELISQHCEQAGYLARIAIADTIGLARAVARHRADLPTVLSPADRQAQQTLPVSALRLPLAIVETLDHLGVRTVGQLQQLPRSELAMRFGQTIGVRLDQLNGVVFEPLLARQRPAEFRTSKALDFPTHHRETIEELAKQLVQRLCKQLRFSQKGALQWRVVLDRVEGAPIDFSIRLFQATATPADVLPLLAMQLEQVLKPHTHRTRRKRRLPRRTAKPVKARTNATKTPALSTIRTVRTMSIDIQEVTIAVTASALLTPVQRRLFDENPQVNQQAITSLINRLTSRIGANNVVRAKLQANAQPEYSFRFQPWVEGRSRKTTRPRKQSHRCARPLRLIHPPQPLPQQDIARTWGPERIETGWWRGRTTCRDYWRVETQDGQHYWVFRDLRTKNWFVQGKF